MREFLAAERAMRCVTAESGVEDTIDEVHPHFPDVFDSREGVEV